MNGYLEPAKMFLRPRPNREAPIEQFSRFMYTLANFEANLVRANLRGYRPHAAIKKFVGLYGELGLEDRERIVYLKRGRRRGGRRRSIRQASARVDAAGQGRQPGHRAVRPPRRFHGRRDPGVPGDGLPSFLDI